MRAELASTRDDVEVIAHTDIRLLRLTLQDGSVWTVNEVAGDGRGNREGFRLRIHIEHAPMHVEPINNGTLEVFAR